MLCELPRCVCGVRIHRVRECDLPVWRIRLAQEVFAHFTRIRKCGSAVTEQGMNLGKEHFRSHVIELGANDRPVQRGGMRGVEHLAVPGEITIFDRKLPRAIVCFDRKVPMPRGQVRVVG